MQQRKMELDEAGGAVSSSSAAMVVDAPRTPRHTEQYGTRVVGATSASRPNPLNLTAASRVVFNARKVRSRVVARMWVVGPREPEDAATDGDSGRELALTHPLEGQESPKDVRPITVS